MSYTEVPPRVRGAVRIALVSGILGSFASLSALAVTSVTLAWDPPASPADIASYNLYYGATSGVYTNVVLAGAATNATITALVPGATYFFAATTVDTLGLESDFSNEAAFSVPGMNQPPTLAALANLTVAENAGQQTVPLAGISSGAANEYQTLSLTVFSSNPSVVPNPTLSYSSPNASGSLFFTPVANAFGSATLTVTVNDSGTSNNTVSRSFTVYVDQPPVISTIPAQVLAVGSVMGPRPFTISDPDSPISSLTLSGSSSNPTVVQNAGIVFGGSNANRTITATPASGQMGVTTITITASDGVASTSTNFRLTVENKPAPPAHVRVVAQAN
jgi:hypothetical protein